MTSEEKLQRCLENLPVNDRRDIPVLLQLITYCGVCAGMTQKEIHESNEKFQQAKKFTYDTIGYPDADYFLNPGDTCFAEALNQFRIACKTACCENHIRCMENVLVAAGNSLHSCNFAVLHQDLSSLDIGHNHDALVGRRFCQCIHNGLAVAGRVP